MAIFRHEIAPADAITLRCNHSTSHVPTKEKTRARSERPPARPEKYTEVLGNDKSKQNFRILTSSKNASFSTNVCHVNNPHVASNLGRCKFIFQFDHTDRQRQTNETAEKYSDIKINLQISAFPPFRHQSTENHVCHELAR